MELGPEQIRHIVTVMVALVASIGLHEFGHAMAAHLLGDDTPKRQGRVTLNPLAHADPVGTLILPLVALVGTGGQSTGFGWGKPVEFQPRNLTRKISMTTGDILVSIAGPGMNLLLGTVLAALHVGLRAAGVVAPTDPISKGLLTAVHLNYALLFFNLLPIPPLDGGHVLAGLVPYRHRRTFERLSVYGPIAVAVVVLTPLRQVLIVPTTFLVRTMYDAFGAIFL